MPAEASAPARRRVPSSSYRLQLRPGFGFAAATAVLPYLAKLGVSHVYCSPWLAAAAGSLHGYDVVDHSRRNPELGDPTSFEDFVATCHELGLGIVLDVVPNHMCVAAPEDRNRAWWDLLAHGRAADHARWFDVDWEAGGGRVLLPVLGAPLDAVLDRGELQLDDELVRYAEHAFPLAPGSAHGTLPQILARQHWELRDWRDPSTPNYRRFFDISTLAAVRVEDEQVFEATHRLALTDVRDGAVDGLRIDHLDGLADPTGYLDRLAERTGGAWVVVEKILEAGEQLDPGLRCAGSTGYDALRRLTGLLTDACGRDGLAEVWRRWAPGVPDRFAGVAAEARAEAVAALAPERARLARAAVAAAAEAARPADPALVAPAVAALLAAMPAYRAYVRPGTVPSAEATRLLDEAARTAGARADADTVALLRALALGAHGRGAARDEFVVRFQQTSGPVVAKGVEDTAFYRWSLLTALNEVGGDPDEFGVSPSAFHEANHRVRDRHPRTMTTLSTHDTKRSEDVRARLLVLAEDPAGWGAAVDRLADAAAPFREAAAPDRPTEYLLWQTVVGAWPIDADRLTAYLEKAVREAKRNTSWTDPDRDYEAALRRFTRRALGDPVVRAEVEGIVDRLRAPGRSNGLAQKLLQLTMPGVPDVYQGCELESLALVDPDNRRAVDFGVRDRLLDELGDAAFLADGGWARDGADGYGAAKLLVTSRALRLRREHPDWFDAAYAPLAADGPAAAHLVGFSRGTHVATLATRLPLGLARAGGWGDTRLTLPVGPWTDLITGATHRSRAVAVADLLAVLPVALLVAER